MRRIRRGSFAPNRRCRGARAWREEEARQGVAMLCLWYGKQCCVLVGQTAASLEVISDHHSLLRPFWPWNPTDNTIDAAGLCRREVWRVRKEYEPRTTSSGHGASSSLLRRPHHNALERTFYTLSYTSHCFFSTPTSLFLIQNKYNMASESLGVLCQECIARRKRMAFLW